VRARGRTRRPGLLAWAAGILARLRSGAAGGVNGVRDRISRALTAVRARWAWFDHLARAGARYERQRGGSLAGAATFFGFLAFFPLLALAFSIAGYAAAISPDAQNWLRTGINDVLPSLASQLPIDSIARAKSGAGVVGLVGLLLSGLGGVGALRDGLRAIFEAGSDTTIFVVRRLKDTAVLIALGLCLVASVAASTTALAATRRALSWVGLSDSAPAGALLRVCAVAVAVIFNMIMFGVIFSRLSGARLPRERLLIGALFGAVAFEVLKLGGVYLIGRTTRNPVYASFAVMVGLLVWINLVARVTFFAAAWTATSQRGAAVPARAELAAARD
jgi:membrane protein